MDKFDWYKTKRLNEQLKFFGAKKKGFISCYAKQVKPRIRIKNKSKPKSTRSALEGVFLSQRDSMLDMQDRSLIALQHQQNQANSELMLAQQTAARGMQTRQGLALLGGAAGSALAGLRSGGHY